MPRFLSEEEFRTPEGRKAAWESLWWGDHGALRKLYDNTHILSPDMRRTYQPSPGHIRRWAKEGVRTVINLRGLVRHKGGKQPGFYWLEKEACEENGIRLVNHRAWSREAPTAEFLTGIDEIFRSIEYPAVMHCKSGADRAGIASVLYYFLREEHPLDDAMDQLSYRYGHVSSGKTGVLDHFFETYRAAAKADGVAPNRAHFLEWADTRYDRDAVTEGFKPGTFGNLLTEVILRRE